MKEERRGEVCDLDALHCEAGMVAMLIAEKGRQGKMGRSWIINESWRNVDMRGWF